MYKDVNFVKRRKNVPNGEMGKYIFYISAALKKTTRMACLTLELVSGRVQWLTAVILAL